MDFKNTDEAFVYWINNISKTTPKTWKNPEEVRKQIILFGDFVSQEYFKFKANEFCKFLIMKEDGMYDICYNSKEVIDEFLNKK